MLNGHECIDSPQTISWDHYTEIINLDYVYQ
jgi:hypothetical protein